MPFYFLKVSCFKKFQNSICTTTP